MGIHVELCKKINCGCRKIWAKVEIFYQENLHLKAANESVKDQKSLDLSKENNDEDKSLKSVSNFEDYGNYLGLNNPNSDRSISKETAESLIFEIEGLIMQEYLIGENNSNIVAYYHLAYWKIKRGVYIEKMVENVVKME